jgi:hypothetical protein
MRRDLLTGSVNSVGVDACSRGSEGKVVVRSSVVSSSEQVLLGFTVDESDSHGCSSDDNDDGMSNANDNDGKQPEHVAGDALRGITS